MIIFVLSDTVVSLWFWTSSGVKPGFSSVWFKPEQFGSSRLHLWGVGSLVGCCTSTWRPRPLFMSLSGSSSATCEMCGMVGVRDAFYSKTKRFCSVSCSRSYSSNSKKASILARLQVRPPAVGSSRPMKMCWKRLLSWGRKLDFRVFIGLLLDLECFISS